MQDWVGQHRFTEGTRLLWNWQLNETQYSSWNAIVDDWEEKGIRPIVYMNPYLADLAEFGIKSELFEEAIRKDYFIKN
jgi:alpha-glucosidase (family GH31 glycosyl hydrolase)